MDISSTPLPKASVLTYGSALVEGELLYSWLARTVNLNPMGPPREQMHRLFGDRNAIPSIDMPTRLLELHRRLAAFAPCTTPEEMIEVGTLYPYHRPFLDRQRDLTVLRILLNNDGKGLKTLMGRVANRFGANPSLRYCPDCGRDDIAQHGFVIWHASHQLPGVSRCAKHDTPLNKHIWTSRTSHRQLLILPPVSVVRHAPQACADLQQLQFARLSVDLLNARLPSLGLHGLNQLYRTNLSNAGLCHPDRRIRHAALSNAVLDHYGSFAGFVHRERLLSSAAHPLYWLHALLEKPHQASHPICHLLLIGFLFQTMQKFQKALHTYQAHNLAPSEITIPRANTQNVPSRPAESDQRTRRHDILLRDTTRSCRQVAFELGLSTTTIATRRRMLGIPVALRVRHVDAEHRTAIEQDLVQGLTPPVVAAHHAVSLSSVYRIRMQIPDLLAPNRARMHAATLQSCRRTWRQVVARHGKKGVRHVRTFAKATYMWLYRHDRAWLLTMCQTIHLARPCGPRLDWATRDLELCNRVEAYVTWLHSQMTRPWISRTRLIRYLGEAVIRTNLHRMPLLAAKLEELSESRETHQKFRIDKAIGRLTQDAVSPPLWRIRAAAGVRQWTPALYAYALDKIASLPFPTNTIPPGHPPHTNRL